MATAVKELTEERTYVSGTWKSRRCWKGESRTCLNVNLAILVGMDRDEERTRRKSEDELRAEERGNEVNQRGVLLLE